MAVQEDVSCVVSTVNKISLFLDHTRAMPNRVLLMQQSNCYDLCVWKPDFNSVFSFPIPR